MAKGRKAGKGEESKKSEFKEIVAEVTDQLLVQARRDVERERWVTPHKLAQRYGVKVSIAKKILKQLEDEGVVVIFTKNRRTPVYLPTKKAPVSPPKGL